jgi:hypothetical protein
VDYPRNPGFRVVSRRRSSGSSSMQVLILALGSEGAPTANTVMDLRTRLDDGDGSEYHPR